MPRRYPEEIRRQVVEMIRIPSSRIFVRTDALQEGLTGVPAHFIRGHQCVRKKTNRLLMLDDELGDRVRSTSTQTRRSSRCVWRRRSWGSRATAASSRSRGSVFATCFPASFAVWLLQAPPPLGGHDRVADEHVR